MAGMFGNRFDVQDALDERLYKEAYNVGQLTSYGVGQMAAYQDGMMGSPLEAAIADQFSPQMQKQKILDDLQRKHPNPDTPEKLNALANDLFANGFGDMGLKVNQAAAELLTASASMVKANAPTADLYKNLASAMSNNVKNTGFVNSYIKTFAPELAGDFKSSGYKTYTEYKDARKTYTDDIDAMFTSWAQSQKYNGATKVSLATLMNDDEDMRDSFIQYLNTHGDTDKAKTMIGLMLQPEIDGQDTALEKVVIDGEVVPEGDATLEAIKIKVQGYEEKTIAGRIILLKNRGAGRSKEETIELQLLNKMQSDISLGDTTNAMGGETAMVDAMGDLTNSPENAFVFA